MRDLNPENFRLPEDQLPPKIKSGPTYVLLMENDLIYNPQTEMFVEKITPVCLLSEREKDRLLLETDLGLEAELFSDIECDVAFMGPDENGDFTMVDYESQVESGGYLVKVVFPIGLDNHVILEDEDFEGDDFEMISATLWQHLQAMELKYPSLGAIELPEVQKTPKVGP